MLFNSFAFILFLPAVFFLYWFVFKSRRSQNLMILVASYIFYGWWDWRFLFLIAITSTCSFFSGILIDRCHEKRNIQRALSAANIIINLLILCYFKYFNFFQENLEILAKSIGYQINTVTLDIILPVGISFYTFQALSYTIDVYRGAIRPTKDIIEFSAYISFFPQLVAGPIERATNLLPQFQKPRHFDYPKAVDGCRQMLWGFFKKLVIADNCALIVNQNWDHFSELPGLQLVIMGVLFTFQIYCDFSGYSDIAIGCARLFGFNLMRNFDFPYFSRSIPEFWRRWHISLTTWFRDYIYFPLGGSRSSKWKTIRNVYVVWGISGLWHGANWTFVCWGLFHATLLAFYNLIGINTKHQHTVAHGRILPTIKESLQMGVTFSLAVVGWIIFRSESIKQAFDYIGAFITNPFWGYHDGKRRLLICIMTIIIMMSAEWLQREKQHALQLPSNRFFRYKAARLSVYLIIFILLLLFVGQVQTFIYFQF